MTILGPVPGMATAMACPDCDGSAHVATRHGRSETITSAARHCCCPSGPHWDRIAASDLGRAWQLRKGLRLAKSRSLPPGFVLVYLGDGWFRVHVRKFRGAVIEFESST